MLESKLMLLNLTPSANKWVFFEYYTQMIINTFTTFGNLHFQLYDK